MRNEYEYGYFLAGYGKARWRRVTLLERLQIRRRKKKSDPVGVGIGCQM